ncbi:MAG: pirin family protein [Planctomycetes bacterium]|nr:pirin family protein [Planctomycetota bacterium]NUQ34782.1 pirin family protein [Planctomycetaceae bacterium]
MLTIRPASERGHADHGWLDTWHTFSFADYYDPAHMGFRALRVINDDVIGPGAGFGTHPHRDMEIVTYVLSGGLKHRDSMGHVEVIHAGEMQRMTAGTGVEHSEFNASETESTHLLQIWIHPHTRGLKPEYEQKIFTDAEKRGKLRLVVSPDGRDGSMMIHQDASIHAAILRKGDNVKHSIAPGRHAWIQVARGSVILDGERLTAGDGVAISDTKEVRLSGVDDGEALLFDLA